MAQPIIDHYQVALNEYCAELMACRDGKRAWVRITAAVKHTGVKRQHLIEIAEAAGLRINYLCKGRYVVASKV